MKGEWAATLISRLLVTFGVQRTRLRRPRLVRDGGCGDVPMADGVIPGSPVHLTFPTLLVNSIDQDPNS